MKEIEMEENKNMELGIENKTEGQTAPQTVRTVTLPKKKKKGNKGLWIFICIVVVFAILAVSAGGVLWEDGDHSYAVSEPYIATVYVEGEIGGGTTDTFGNPIGYQHQWTLDQIDYLMSDHNNVGIILYVDSPGGSVFESDELYLKIKEYQEKTKQPVYAYMGAYAASGGYYVLASADKIVANRNTWTGSIGVKLGSIVDVSDLLQRYGVKVTNITSGNNKNIGSMLEPTTDEQRAILQGLVNEAYDQFVGVVSEGTGLNVTQVRALADGRVYTAKQALILGLVDGIGTYEQVEQEIKEDYNLGDCEVVQVLEHSNSFIGMMFSRLNLDGIFASRGDVGQIISLVEEETRYPISYLCDLVK